MISVVSILLQIYKSRLAFVVEYVIFLFLRPVLETLRRLILNDEAF